MKALERFFVAKGDKIDIPVVIMAMEYCRKLRHLSTRIFDQSAAHFAQNAALYGPTDMYLVLRPFGQMNYVPHNADRVFEEVEIKLNGETGFAFRSVMSRGSDVTLAAQS